MNVSVFSCLTAIGWFSLIVLLAAILRRRSNILTRLGLWPVTFLLIVGLLRLFFPVTLPATKVVHSTALLPSIQRMLQQEAIFLPITFGDCLLGIWIAGTIMNLIKLVRDILLYRQSIRKCTHMEDSRINGLIYGVTGKKNCRYILTQQVSTPMMTGFWRPVFILPAYLADFTDEEIGLILCHEWQHFYRHNNWYKLLIELLVCLLWWNPAIYLLRWEAEQIMELDCDQKVIQKYNQQIKAAYLETIIKSIRHEQTRSISSDRLSLHLFGTKNSINIRQRFQMVARQNKTRYHRAITLIYTLCLSIMIAASWLIVVQPFRILTRDEMAQLKITAYDISPEDSYVIENEDGEFVNYFFDVPVYTYPGVIYEFTPQESNFQYINLGNYTDPNNVLTIHNGEDGITPVFIRNENNHLVPVKLPQGILIPDTYNPSADKHESIIYARNTSRYTLEYRTWSITYQCWLNDWGDID